MSSVSQYAQILREILEERASVLARETGFIQRERTFDGADFAVSLIFAWLQEPQISLDGLVQVLCRREVSISASGLTQRFSPASAELFERLLEALTQADMQAEAEAQSALLRRFEAVLLEEASSISLPNELATVWQGCGGGSGRNQAAVKLYVRWDVLGGQLWGPSLTDGKHDDHHSPLSLDEVPAGALSIADLGFFSQQRLLELCRGGRNQRRYVVSRLLPKTGLYTRGGHRINLRAILPQRVGEARDLGVLLGKKARLPMRLILVRVPASVAEQRRAQLRDSSGKHGRPPEEETLVLADWTIVVSNVPRRLLSLPEVLVVLRLRWQIERLFRLWKEHGHLDEWRSKKPWRVLTDLYAKLCAMLIQQWLIHEGCWFDPARSIVKAAQVVRREAARVMAGLSEGHLEAVLSKVIALLRGPGCRLNRRKKQPSTAQLLQQGLDWPLLLT